VIAEPPSLLGAVHETTSDEFVALEALTLAGPPGAPGMVDVALAGLENVPVPAVLTAAIWNT
jgi:hypothetical protein